MSNLSTELDAKSILTEKLTKIKVSYAKLIDKAENNYARGGYEQNNARALAHVILEEVGASHINMTAHLLNSGIMDTLDEMHKVRFRKQVSKCLTEAQIEQCFAILAQYHNIKVWTWL